MLGCSGTFPGPESACSGYLLEHDGYRLVVDLGRRRARSAAAARRPARRRRRLRQPPARRPLHRPGRLLLRPPLPPRRHAAAAAGLRPRRDGAAHPGRLRGAAVARAQDVYDFREVAPGTRAIGPFTVTAAQVNHPVECHGLRIEAGGRSLAYSGDTGESDALVGLADGVDLFLCEASWASADDNPPDIHLSGRQAGEHAAKAGAARLLLTHVVPWADPQVILARGRRGVRRPDRAGHLRHVVRRLTGSSACPDTTAARPTSSAPSSSPAGGWTTPRGRAWSSSGGPGCSSPPALRRASRAGARAPGWAG